MTASSSKRDPGLPLPMHPDGEVSFERTIEGSTDHLTSRSRARIRALDVIFEADARQREVSRVLADRQERTAAQTPLNDFAIALVQLYAEHRDQIDEQLATFAQDWPLHRMPATDRAIMRLGAAELLAAQQPEPRAAVISEWVKIAEVLSTDDSPRFINAMLQRLADVRELTGGPGPTAQ